MRNNLVEHGRTWRLVELGEVVGVQDASAYSLRDWEVVVLPTDLEEQAWGEDEASNLGQVEIF